ncbi:Rrf2 family transcriptional regulator [Kangiella sediminilitoris]|uniref:Transcriptional regulator, BadM/Rrf2 family n=1 Tax=Kangiella sediminilitoris TaxID=1144748 RepID=A0A1B3B8W4_9GAMM|nr:Rrf2 family transcriptional regulator [Kangiella sediminilitoris]AOE49244.1 Transcriptional regulator, BadM/Rrf2 family [Kangiella sediminilitoris]
MHITRYTDYSLRVLIYLSLNKGKRTTIKDIADSYDISKNHLMKVVHNLNKIGYIDTLRGKKGGMSLSVAPEDINIGRLVMELEPDFSLVECFTSKGNCAITPVCELKSILASALSAFLQRLNQYTLADVVAKGQEEKALSILGIDDVKSAIPFKNVG